MANDLPPTQSSDPSPPDASLEPTEIIPTQIGRFRIERILGQGGFGVVYLGHDEQLQRKVAIKVPKPQFVQRQEDREVVRNRERYGQINNRPGGSGRPQGSKAPPGFFLRLPRTDIADKTGSLRKHWKRNCPLLALRACNRPLLSQSITFVGCVRASSDFAPRHQIIISSVRVAR